MELKCYLLPNLWPVSGCNAVYWAIAIAALIFTYQYHKSATVLHSQIEETSTISSDYRSDSTPDSASSHHQRPFPNSLDPGPSVRAWRVATIFVFLSQTFLAAFAALFTYSWIEKLHVWALGQESGSRPVVILNALLLCIWTLCILHFLGRGYISLVRNVMLFDRMDKLEKFHHAVEMHLPSRSSPPSCGRNAIKKIRVESPSGSPV